jgi:two-component system cell cycle response regulator DivK
MARLLLVEDNELSRDMLSRRLTRRGHQVLVAADGQAGVEVAAEQRPDLILLDLTLPVLDAWAATRRLKAEEGTRPIPVLALTSQAMAGDRQQALDAGCDDYDTIPIDLPRLLAKIAALLARASSEALSRARGHRPHRLAAGPAAGPAWSLGVHRPCSTAGAVGPAGVAAGDARSAPGPANRSVTGP